MSWTLNQGDCIEGLRTLADKSVDVCLMDPPYEAEAHTKQRRVKRGDVCVTEDLPFVAITEAQRTEVAWHVARVTRRWVLTFCQVEGAPHWRSALTSAPFRHEYVRTMVWVKPDAMPQFTGDRPGMGYESIVVTHPKGRKVWNGGGRVGVFVHNKNGSTPGPAPHPTTKPLPLMRELVSLFSNPGELVLDPFAGSGTTLVACKQLGRRAIGWELDRAYFEIAQRRINGDEAKPRFEQPGLFDAVYRR